MDSFSGRSSRSVPPRESTASRSVEEAPRPVETAAPVRQASTRPARHESRSRRPKVLWSILIAAVLLLALLGYFLWRSQTTALPGVNTDRYQAIWLTDKSLYFGKLHAVNNEYYQLTDVFYTQVAQTTDNKDAANSPNVQLVKLGNELPYAEDAIMIPKQQVLFYENLKTDSKVTQAIQSYAASHK